MLIISVAAALRSDAQGPSVPRRLDLSVTFTALKAPANTENEADDPPLPGDVNPMVEPKFSYLNQEHHTVVPPGRPPEAVELFNCDFGPAWDANFDNWPDRWSREQSVDFPHYLKIGIVDDPSPKNSAAAEPSQAPQRALRVELNGGAAAVHTPPIEVHAMYTYVVEAYVRTEGLKHDEACLALTFLDANNKPLETIRSEPIRRTTDWTKVRIGPVASTSQQVESALVTLHLGPTDKVDLKGFAWFKDIWLGRLPRMTLTADHRSHLYFDNETPQITCSASGFAEQHTKVIFELLDVRGDVAARGDVGLVAKQDTRSSTTPWRAGAGRGAQADTTGTGEAEITPSKSAEPPSDDQRPHSAAPIFAGTAVWEPRLPKPGFYRVRVEMPGKTGVANRREISLALARRLPAPVGGEFGWSLPTGEETLTLTQLAEVMGHSGCNWCKFPLWDESHPADREEQLVWFAERLGLRRIELVGLLSQPPEALQKQLFGAESQQAAGIFSMPTQMWYPSLEPIMTRLSLKVRWWQLGLDRDQSFVGYPELGKKIEQLKKQFTRYGQRVNLGMGWSWLKELPAEKPTWDFLTLSADPPLTWEEQITYLRATKDRGYLRWVVLDPLPRDHYSLETRTADLAMRMIAAKMEGADGVFVPQAFSDSAGILNQDGTVGELFIPWRTAAHVLAGAKPLGSLQLPSNCRTQVFQRGEEIVMAIWSDQPTSVSLFLGEDARQIDLWGRETRLPMDKGVQTLQVGPTPIFVTQISAALMRTQMSVQFEHTKLASLFGQPQYNGVTFKSYFPQSIRGQVRIVTPGTWKVAPKDIDFKTAPGETMYQQFEVALPQDATTGRQLLRLDFDLTADSRYQFSIYRQLEVGLSDVYGEAFTRLNENGELEVEQRITNETDEVLSFKCYLYPPDRKRLMMHVEDHGRGVDVKTFRLYDGEKLLNQTLFLRAVEINGPRILNYTVVAQP
ncbi:MAG: hypothetical protein WD894_12340 [Pirellulales bacterium]